MRRATNRNGFLGFLFRRSAVLGLTEEMVLIKISRGVRDPIRICPLVGAGVEVNLVGFEK
ncbi:MAG: hypothetical protein WBW98_05270 [Candidatus Sulfotelmatobacter sp.]